MKSILIWIVSIVKLIVSIIKFIILILTFTINHIFGRFSPNSLSPEQLCNLSDNELVITIITSIDNKYSSVQSETEKLLLMNNSELVAYTAGLFDMEIMNGGLCQYFINSSRDTAPYVSDALIQIGAPDTENLFTDFITNNNINVNELSLFISETIEESTQMYDLYPFDDFDDAYIDTYEYENIEALNAKFIREHISDFAN